VNDCAVTPDGRRVISASTDGTLKVWDLETRHLLLTVQGTAKEYSASATVLACTVTPDGRRVLSASMDSTLKLWDLETGRTLATLEGHGWGVNA
jgi:WD40 repeat protein